MLNKQPILRRLLALTSGTVLGQGLLFVTTAHFLTKDTVFIGDIGTGYGLALLLAMIVDWGGNTTQRQIIASNSALPNLWQLCLPRAPIAVAAGTVVFMTCESSLPNPATAAFLLGALPGALSYALNISGLLDVIDEHADHAYLQFLPPAALSIYLLTSSCPTPFTAGALFSSGTIALICAQLLILKLKNHSHRNCPSSNPATFSAQKLYIEGFYVLTTNLPGQIISRIVPTTFAATGLSSLSAAYNFLKQSQGFVNQVVTLMRRAEYNRAAKQVASKPNATNVFEIQKFSIKIGFACGLIGNVILLFFSNRLGLEASIIATSFIQSLVWIVTSSYFFQAQLLAKNSKQALYSFVLLLIFLSLFLTLKPETTIGVLILEIASSAISFALFMHIANTFEKNE